MGTILISQFLQNILAGFFPRDIRVLSHSHCDGLIYYSHVHPGAVGGLKMLVCEV